MASISTDTPAAAQKSEVMTASAKNRPDTPCVAVCSTLFDDICRGCGRTATEVSHWVFMSEVEKDAVWERITREGYPKRKG